MTPMLFYGHRPPNMPTQSLPGRLIAIEGTDGVGRSTHVALLKEWLEARGFAVLDTGFTRSALAGAGIQRAKQGHTLDPMTLNLFYATDFWDRLERQIVPALKAGMIALTDRYIFSLIARATVRGVRPEWIEALYGFAPVPDLVVYLDVDVDRLIPRVLSSTGFDYWESGQDYLPGDSLFDNFVQYQTDLLSEFRRLSSNYGFKTLDARGSVADVFGQICGEVEPLLASMQRESEEAE
ncbi:MAG: thymidylate kinase [Candidatus Eisenbacteria bacterium]|nr:thymidylate kinase [Candidatus Eisenbacteria bacterium]